MSGSDFLDMSMPLVVPMNVELAIREGRSSRWPSVREKHLVRFPACACCGGVRMLNVHHVTPFHAAPELELEPSNLLTLCEGSRGFNCHLWVGHCGNWSSWNDKAIADAAAFLAMLRNRRGVFWKN